MIDLPEDFLRQMKQLLPEREYDAFLQTYAQPASHGLRVNTLKITPEAFEAWAPFSLQTVPWCPSGFYYDSEARPGLHPYHRAGLYYIQEPSAMAVVELLDPQPGERILDLCAAPGGKATHIAAKLAGEGWLVANEIHRQRVKVLTENIERCGVTNATIVNAAPDQLADRFQGFFDRILVDAPCSGEGMFRKNRDAISEWRLKTVTMCAARQKAILHDAVPMLRPGGRLVYSTCTFNDQENETVVSETLRRFPELTLIEPPNKPYPFAPGVPSTTKTHHLPLDAVFRLWPHKLTGEGHFIAVFQKREDAPDESGERKSARSKQKNGQHLWLRRLDSLDAFMADTWTMPRPFRSLVAYGSHLYHTHPDLPVLDGLRVVRPGFYVGQMKKRRFEPSHALAMASRAADVQRVIRLSIEDTERIEAYARGESLILNTPDKGWALVTVDGFPLGWGKQDGTVLKNHLPKYLRKHM